LLSKISSGFLKFQQLTYEEGGFGGIIIAGVDFDGDGMPEIYALQYKFH
jgi:hypothetical protein